MPLLLLWPRLVLMLMLPPWLLAGCETPRAQPLIAPAVPPLPAQARQPAPLPWCLPTCSKALTAERENWRRQLTQPESPASPASGPTMR